MPHLPAITNLDRDQLEGALVALGEPKYRATQVLEWVYRKRATDFGAMSNLPASLRDSAAGGDEVIGSNPI